MKKYFYAAVIDNYQYSKVSMHRFKNFVDFAIWCWEDTIDEDLWQEFFEDYYGYGVYYFALDEEGNELEDIEDNNTTFNNYIANNIKI